MARKSDRRALGRGLSALLGETETPAPVAADAATAEAEAARPGAPSRIPIERIAPNPSQPRQTFRDAELDELAASLRTHGVIQPVLLRPDPAKPGQYQIVAGERRWRAAQRAGVHELPAVIRTLDDREILELAIIENVQRVDLDAIEEAQGYAQLVETFGYTQDQLAEIIGKSRSHLSNSMRLLGLPGDVIDMIRAGKLSAGHGRALVTAADPVGLATEAVAKGLTVRQVEAIAKGRDPGARTQAQLRPTRIEKDADTKLLEGDLSATIGMRVQIEHQTADGGGEVRIRYKTLDELDALCRKLSE